MTIMTAVDREDMLARVEFYCPFRVTEAGTIEEGVIEEIHAPEVWHDEHDDMLIDGTPYRQSRSWDALVGYTGQYGYNGPVMHASEFLGGRIAADILETPGVYVLVPVEAFHDEDCGHDDFDSDFDFCEPAGWAVLRLREAPRFTREEIDLYN